MYRNGLLIALTLTALSACGKQEAPTPTTTETAPPPMAAPEPAPAVEPAAPARLAEAPAPDAGKAKYNAACASCHGRNAEGMGTFPKLAGQPAAALADKLKKYKAGEKIGPQSPVMMPFAKALSDAEIEQVSAYIATL